MLWDLAEDADYIIQVQSIGLYGESQASKRVHFRTLKQSDRLPSNSSNQGRQSQVRKRVLGWNRCCLLPASPMTQPEDLQYGWEGKWTYNAGRLSTPSTASLSAVLGFGCLQGFICPLPACLLPHDCSAMCGWRRACWGEKPLPNQLQSKGPL